MERKQIDFVTHPQETHMVGDGFRVHNFIPQMPGMSRYDMDPFLLLDYNAAMLWHPVSRVELGHTRTGDSLRSRLLIEAVWSIVTAAAIME